MNINIFLLCYNENILLPHTIAHYKKYLPSCKITIYDNESEDNSVELAKSLGCEVISWSSGNIIDDFKYKEIKNNCWKEIKDGWIIMADMDEWLCVTEDELRDEMNKGTSLLNIQGLDMIGESNTEDLSDIDLHTINKYNNSRLESKRLCFLRNKITEMNYGLGAHGCSPRGNVKSSKNSYKNKHMSYLGLPFLINKMIKRHERSALMRSKGLGSHYTKDIIKIRRNYNSQLSTSKIIE